jgi:4-amino-4-deoxy-L-arabinose transferase-like glycosyltransferase
MSKHTPLIVALAAYLVFGALFAVRVPAWQAPDEPAHYNYVASLARGVWPTIETSDWDPALVPIAPDAKNVAVERITYQDHQPPLFYALGAPVFLVSGGSLTALRLWTLLIGAIGVAACYGVVISIFPGRAALAGAAAAFYALLPQHLHVVSSYNNDALSEALLALTVLQAVRMMRDVPTTQRVLLLATTAGLAMWTKAQAYLALPIGALALLMADPAAARGERLRRAASFVGVAVAIAAPLWMRNIVVYGGLDFLGLQAHNRAVAGQLTAAALIGQVGVGDYLRQALQTTFQSFWAMFGWMSVLPGARIYQALLGVTAASAAAFVWWWLRDRRALDEAQRRGMLLAAALFGASVVAYAWYNMQFVQFQGRYLYPGLIPIALGAALGWAKLAARAPRVSHWWWLGVVLLFVGLDAYMLLRVIGPGFGG